MPGVPHVVTRFRGNGAAVNLRTHLLRIIARAGERPWPKLFHNLRASRQTELEEEFPTHVVCAWLGNSEAVARAHYLQVRDTHFDRANGRGDAAQNPAQKASEQAGNSRGGSGAETRNARDFRTFPTCSDTEHDPNGIRTRVASLNGTFPTH